MSAGPVTRVLAAPFQLVHQWGVTYPPGAGASALVFPFTAQWTPRNTCLILDRKLPLNRLAEIAPDGTEMWAIELPPRMNFARMLNSGDIVLTRGDVLYRLSRGGAPQPIATLPDGVVPNCGDVQGEVIVLGSDRGVDRYTAEGEHVGHIPAGESTFVEPVGLSITAEGHLLVADGEASCIVETNAAGERIRIFGRWRRPGSRDGRLSCPLGACRLPDGQTLVADWRAHRVARYDTSGAEIDPLVSADGRLFGPAEVSACPGGVLIAETGNRRVSRWSLSGELLWSYGPDGTADRTLSFPRSAVPGPAGSLLVCDSYHDRVVLLGPGGETRWEFGDQGSSGSSAGLSIPRAATQATDGRVCIADGLNSRILVVDPAGTIERELTSVGHGARRVPLGDPHHAVIAGTNLLVVDADRNRVFLVDEQGDVLLQWGDDSPRSDPEARLADPHNAHLLDDGGLLVADSGQHRIVEYDRLGHVRAVLRETISAEDPQRRSPLRYPRCVALLGSGDLVVADTDNARIVGVARSGLLLWQVGPAVDVRGDSAASPELRVPKWVAVDHRGRLIVTDYFNSRVAMFDRPSETP